MVKVNAKSKDIKKKKPASPAKPRMKTPVEYFDKVKRPFTPYKSLLDIPATDIDGKKIKKLGDILEGKEVILVVAGLPTTFAYDYSYLNSLYEKFSDKGLEILAFPCDQFNDEEPGTNKEIK